MINLNMKPILRNTYNIEKKQPNYSTFLIEINNKIIPISVNESGADILRMCNGKNEIRDIIHSLIENNDADFDEKKKFVIEFLEDMQKNNAIDYNDNFFQIENIRFGSRNYWTPDKVSVEMTDAYLTKNTNYLSDDVFYNILFDMKNMDIENLQITGEPLLHKNLFNYLNKAIELGIACQVTTSGHIYNNEILDSFRMIADYNKLTVQVNIDGLEDYQDNFRGIKGAYEKSMSFIDSIVKMGISVNVACCISNQSYTEINSLAKFLKDKGVGVFQINPITNSGKATVKAISFNCKQIDQIASKLKSEFEDANFKIVKDELDSIEAGCTGLTNCGLGQTQLKIDSFGQVYPCMLSNMVIGNVCEETIKSIQKRNSTLFEKISPQNIETYGRSNKSIRSACIIQDLILNENSRKPSKWYYSQMKFINAIRNINDRRVLKK